MIGCFAINRLHKEVIEKREEEIIHNIYHYSKNNSYNQAILFIGSGHRKSMIKKINDCNMKECINVNWSVYHNL